MGLADTAQHAVEDRLNSQGRSLGHIALGVGVCLAAVGATTAIAALRAPQVQKQTRNPAADRGDILKAMAPAVLPALFSAASISALRIWNAPSGPRRNRALALWGVMQAVNAAVLWFAPRQKSAQLVGALATAGVTAAYGQAAGKVDGKAAKMVSPVAALLPLASVGDGAPPARQSLKSRGRRLVERVVH